MSCQRTTALLLSLATTACFSRKPGDDRLPRDAGAVAELRLVQPAHGAVVTRRRPVVRWRSSVASLAWSVEFCADIRCERVLQQATTAEVTVAPAADLPTGLVFWRVTDPTRVGVASTMRWFNVPRGLPSGAPPTTGALTSPTQFDGDADGRVESLDADGTLRRLDDGASVVARLARTDVTHLIAAGDVDGDGVPDLAALAGTARPAPPAVVVWRGPVQGDAIAPTWRVPLPADFPDRVNRSFALTAGDLDGDGFRDLVVSSTGSLEDRGQVYVLPGGARGPSADAVVTLSSPRGQRSLFRAFDAADLDGDGCDELLAAAPGLSSADAGVSLIYRGTPDGLDPLPVWSNARVALDNDRLGVAGAFADVDGDGALDVVLTAPRARARGCVYTFPWLPGSRTIASDPSSGTCGDGSRAADQFGTAVAMGDFDADGYADVVVAEDAGERALVWTARGGRGGLDEGGVSALPGTDVTFGIARMSATDLDGDGYADLLVENFAGGQLRLQGSPTGLRPFDAR